MLSWFYRSTLDLFHSDKKLNIGYIAVHCVISFKNIKIIKLYICETTLTSNSIKLCNLCQQ